VLGPLDRHGFGPQGIGLGEPLVDLLLAVGQAVAMEGAQGSEGLDLGGLLAQGLDIGEEGDANAVLSTLSGRAGPCGLQGVA